MGKIWKAREGVIKIADTSTVTITNAAALDTFFGSGSAMEADMKGIEITEPETTVDKIDLLGQDTNSFQNADFEEKPAGVASITGTMVLRGDESGLDQWSYDAASIAGPAGFTRLQIGSGTGNQASLLVNLDDGTDEVNLVLDNAFITTRDKKLTGSDGHWEVSFSATCLARDYFVEFKD